jgi:hypothetical protein
VIRHSRASSCAVRLSSSCVEITDNGTGSDAPPGNGLHGLRERAAGVGGAVDADPLRPRGWRLLVWVPAASAPRPADGRSEAAESSPLAAAQRRGALIRLLLADDQELIRSALAIMLALEEDFEVVASVGRGDEAAAAVREHYPDVALLDIEMPGLDGIAVAGVLAHEARTAGRSSSSLSAVAATCAGRWSRAPAASSPRMRRPNSSPARSAESRPGTRHRPGAGCPIADHRSLPAVRPGAGRPGRRASGGHRVRDRREAVPVRRNRPQLPIRRDRQDRDTQPRRGGPDGRGTRLTLSTGPSTLTAWAVARRPAFPAKPHRHDQASHLDVPRGIGEILPAA